MTKPGDADPKQRPLKPGSAKTRLAAALGVEEKPAGEAAPISDTRKPR